jgi:hypothetical protein
MTPSRGMPGTSGHETAREQRKINPQVRPSHFFSAAFECPVPEVRCINRRAIVVESRRKMRVNTPPAMRVASGSPPEEGTPSLDDECNSHSSRSGRNDHPGIAGPTVSLRPYRDTRMIGGAFSSLTAGGGGWLKWNQIIYMFL